jgi:FkbM family methyltransferase
MLRVRDLLLQRVEILNGPVRYRFDCGSVREFNRCLKMLTKEPGTVEWIETECAPGDVFYDIGANIGVFSIFAARRIEPGGKLYAFEPHAANFERLLANIECNNLQAVITPCSLPLHRHEEFGIFRYESLMAGSSSSQFGDSRAERPALEELKFAVSIDHLIETGRITAPHHIKIDRNWTFCTE